MKRKGREKKKKTAMGSRKRRKTGKKARGKREAGGEKLVLNY